MTDAEIGLLADAICKLEKWRHDRMEAKAQARINQMRGRRAYHIDKPITHERIP